MINFTPNLISHRSSVIEAMQQLETIPSTLTLFVLNDDNKLIGTLTDGDIRRGFLRGLDLSGKTSEFMTTEYRTIDNSESVSEFKTIRNVGIRLLPELDDSGHIQKVYDLKTRKSNLPLECVIMAGGRGERLRPLTDDTPKPMLGIGGKPILEHNIDQLISYGIEKIYITILYLGQQIMDYFGDGSAKGISIEYIWEDKPLGTAGALTLIKNIETKYIVLMNSDLFTDVDIEDLFLSINQNEADMGIASVLHTVKIPYGIFDEEDQKIRSIREKPVFTHYANAGVYILRKELIQYIPQNSFYDITDLIEGLLKMGMVIIQNPIVGYWIDIGKHDDYQRAQEIAKHLS